MHSLSFDRCIYPHNKDIVFHSKGTPHPCVISPHPNPRQKYPSDAYCCRLVCLLECHRNILLITMRFLTFIHVVACISGSEVFSLGTVDIEQDNSLSWRLSHACGLFSSILTAIH